jgi:hypothetical protein
MVKSMKVIYKKIPLKINRITKDSVYGQSIVKTNVLSGEFLTKLQNPLFWMNLEMIKQTEDLR